MVGIFVAVGIAILITGIFTLGGQQQVFTPSLRISAIFDNVNGLQKGNNVWFSGVKVGTVQDVSFYGTSQVKVTMDIEKKAREYIRSDARARISSEGLIGSKLVVIYEGTQAAPPVTGGENLQTEEAINTDDMMATLQANNKNLAVITSDLKTVSQRLVNGKGSLGALLTDETLYKNLQTTAANLRTAARNSEAFTNSIADYTARLQTPGTLASDLVSDTVVMANLKSTVRQINEAAASVSAFSDKMKATANQLNYSLTDDDNTLGMLLNDEGTADDLRNLIGNLRVSSIRLDENLEALQHSIFLRGFFRKKARKEDKMLKDVKK